MAKNKTMTYRTVVFILIALTAILLYWLYFNNQSHVEVIPSTSLTNNPPSSKNEPPAASYDVVQLPGQVDNTAAITINTDIRTKAINRELEDLHSKMGLFSEEDNDSYKAYSIEALEEMGELGDVLALDTLAGIYYKAGELENGHNALKKAAMYGSIFAPSTLGNVMAEVAEARSMMAGKFTPAAREDLLEAMAWINLAIVRDTPLSHIKDEFEKRLNKPSLGITAAEEQKIQYLTQKLYKDLLHKRQERGLGDFNQEAIDELNRMLLRD